MINYKKCKLVKAWRDGRLKRYKKLFTIFTLIPTLLIFSVLLNVNSAAAEEDPLGLKAKAAIIVDAETGKVLYEKNADELLGVASMSKMLTEYIVLESIHEGKITWDQEVIINEFIHNLSKAPDLSNVGLTQGEAYTVEELYQAMAIHSGNAATVALAELIAGTETNFVKLMNQKAKELGLKNYKFVNSTGLNNENMLGNHPEGTGKDEENLMSARDTAKLAFRLINDFPEVLETSSMTTLKFRDGKEYPNFNFMVPGLIFEYEGVDGIKTGSTDFAGYCFTSTAERNGQRFITVVMNLPTMNDRFIETQQLLNYAFNNFSKETLFKEGLTFKNNKTLPVIKGKKDKVKIATKDPIELVIKNGEKDKYKAKLVIDKDKLNKDGQLVAPVKKGDVVGYVTYEYDGTDYGFIDGKDTVRVDVVATETVEKANWFVLMMRGIGGFFSDLWSSITSAISSWF